LSAVLKPTSIRNYYDYETQRLLEGAKIGNCRHLVDVHIRDTHPLAVTLVYPKHQIAEQTGGRRNLW